MQWAPYSGSHEWSEARQVADVHIDIAPKKWPPAPRVKSPVAEAVKNSSTSRSFTPDVLGPFAASDDGKIESGAKLIRRARLAIFPCVLLDSDKKKWCDTTNTMTKIKPEKKRAAHRRAVQPSWLGALPNPKNTTKPGFRISTQSITEVRDHSSFITRMSRYKLFALPLQQRLLKHHMDGVIHLPDVKRVNSKSQTPE